LAVLEHVQTALCGAVLSPTSYESGNAAELQFNVLRTFDAPAVRFNALKRGSMRRSRGSMHLWCGSKPEGV